MPSPADPRRGKGPNRSNTNRRGTPQSGPARGPSRAAPRSAGPHPKGGPGGKPGPRSGKPQRSGPLPPLRTTPAPGPAGARPTRPPKRDVPAFDRAEAHDPKPDGDKPLVKRPGTPWRKGIWLIHQDDDILVLDKPTNMAVARPPGEKIGKASAPTLVDLAAEEIEPTQDAEDGPRFRLKAINWIETESSGLVLLARNAAAAEALRDQFRSASPERIAHAVVFGQPRSPAIRGGEGSISEPLAEPAIARPGTRAARRAGQKLPAVTHVKVISSGQGRTLLRLRLETDRVSQARLHLRHLGTPILGDAPDATAKFSAPRKSARIERTERLMLHLSELAFIHPSTDARVRYISPPPPAFHRLTDSDGTPAEAPVADSWEHVADWYGSLVGSGQSDHHEKVILPGVLRLLEPLAGKRILDVACGEGSICRALQSRGAEVVGVDGSPSLIERARAASPESIRYEVADARNLKADALGTFNAATCVMAIMNIDPHLAVFKGLAHCLKPGASLVLVLLHPAFRAPGRSFWGWDDRAENPVQFRRVDAYLSPSAHPVVMNPGAAAHGADPITTTTYVRPIGAYISALAQAGFALDAFEEWVSARRSQPGPRATAENRARREIPLFLALRAHRRASSEADAGTPEPSTPTD